MKHTLRMIIQIFFVGLFCLGFRTIPNGEKWIIDGSTSTNSKLFVDFPSGTTAVPNDLPLDDALGGAGATVTVSQLMDSIFDDFNGINGSFVTLVDTSDADFNTTTEIDRTITVKFGSVVAGSDGIFVSDYENGRIVDCEVSIAENQLESAKDFVWIVNHEMAHCLGLSHPQETEDAVMSYFSDREQPRLRIDDKMGLAFLYPVDSNAGSEDPTFGMTCDRK